MRQYIILVAAFAFVIILNCIQINFLKDTSKDLKKQLSILKSSIEQENYTQAEGALSALKKYWESVRQKWDIFTEHDDVEEVESHLASLQAYLTQNKKAECVNEIYVLKQRLEHITENESLSFATVF